MVKRQRVQRKKLLEFASWLAKRRGQFNVGDPEWCIAGWALRWVRIFGLDYDVAATLYAENWEASKMQAVQALRNLANPRFKDHVWAHVHA